MTEKVSKMIDYEGIAKFYLKICSTISKTARNAMENEGTKEAAEKDYDDMYWRCTNIGMSLILNIMG